MSSAAPRIVLYMLAAYAPSLPSVSQFLYNSGAKRTAVCCSPTNHQVNKQSGVIQQLKRQAYNYHRALTHPERVPCSLAGDAIRVRTQLRLTESGSVVL